MQFKRQAPSFFLVNLWDTAKWVWPSLAGIPIYIKWTGSPMLVWTLVIVAIGGSLIYDAVSYYRTTYAYLPDGVMVKSGAFNIKTRHLREGSGLLNIRLEQNWVQHLMGVKGLTLYFENGTEESELKFQALTLAELAPLEQALDALIKADAIEVISQATSVDENWERPSLSYWDLMLTGIFSWNYIAVLSVIATAMSYLGEKLDHLNVEGTVRHLGPVVTGGVLVVFLLIVAVGSQYLKVDHFRIKVSQDHFLTKNGWLNHDENILRKADITGIQFDQTLGMRLLGLWGISAVMNPNQDMQGSQTKNMLFPYVKADQVAPKIAEVLPEFAVDAWPERRRWTRGKWTYAMIVGLLALILVAATWPWLSYASVIIGLIFSLLFGHRLWTQFDLTADYLLITKGLMHRRRIMLPVTHLGEHQTVTVGRWWQTLSYRTDRNPSRRYTELS